MPNFHLHQRIDITYNLIFRCTSLTKSPTPPYYSILVFCFSLYTSLNRVTNSSCLHRLQVIKTSKPYTRFDLTTVGVIDGDSLRERSPAPEIRMRIRSVLQSARIRNKNKNKNRNRNRCVVGHCANDAAKICPQRLQLPFPLAAGGRGRERRPRSPTALAILPTL